MIRRAFFLSSAGTTYQGATSGAGRVQARLIRFHVIIPVLRIDFHIVPFGQQRRGKRSGLLFSFYVGSLPLASRRASIMQRLSWLPPLSLFSSLRCTSTRVICSDRWPSVLSTVALACSASSSRPVMLLSVLIWIFRLPP